MSPAEVSRIAHLRAVGVCFMTLRYVEMKAPANGGAVSGNY